MKKIMFAIFAFTMLAGLLVSELTGLDRLKSAISQLCTALSSLLPIAAMLMIIFAGVIYASGQIMGAETRARANVWATAALTGALIAILIATVAPAVLDTIYDKGTIQCNQTS